MPGDRGQRHGAAGAQFAVEERRAHLEAARLFVVREQAAGLQKVAAAPRRLLRLR
ncbi:MAG: hypothetical protein MUF16_03625 [Burkholderiaceae bacterium]|nr:hypothetical protein [Burkholderiaceae bacterium]